MSNPKSAQSVTAQESAAAVAASIQRKADKYRRLSKRLTLGIAAITASIPVLIGLPIDCDLVKQTLPSVLAAFAALMAVWLQIEKPQERWSMYRKYQRMMEAEMLEHRHRSGRYLWRNPDRLLTARVAKLQLELHDEWAGLVPSSESASRGVSGLR